MGTSHKQKASYIKAKIARERQRMSPPKPDTAARMGQAAPDQQDRAADAARHWDHMLNRLNAIREKKGLPLL